MKNLWIQTENAFVTWVADFTAVATRPASIAEFVQVALAAGARHRVFEVVEAPVIGYRRDRDGSLADVVERLFDRDRVLDLFGFTGAAMLPGHPQSSTVEATLCHFDRDDRRVEHAVTDLGAVLAALEPAPGSIPRGFMSHYPPVRITGRRYPDVRDGVAVDGRANRLRVAAYVAIHSDIWFPWVYGSAHPECDHRRMFDNRELASQHTPRLNAFLAEIAAAARRAGGSFGMEPGETGVRAAHWADDEQVRLDWRPEAGVMPPEALAVAWY